MQRLWSQQHTRNPSASYPMSLPPLSRQAVRVQGGESEVEYLPSQEALYAVDPSGVDSKTCVPSNIYVERENRNFPDCPPIYAVWCLRN